MILSLTHSLFLKRDRALSWFLTEPSGFVVSRIVAFNDNRSLESRLSRVARYRMLRAVDGPLEQLADAAGHEGHFDG